MGLHQTKMFWHSKRNHQEKKKKKKTHGMEWEDIFTDTSDKGLISKIYNELTKLNRKKQTTKSKNGQRI